MANESTDSNSGHRPRQSPPTEFLEPLGSSALDGFSLPSDSPEFAGVAIGPYKLLERIGEGGFGEVWTAEQREPVQRKVALKLIKPGMDTREVIARFRAERKALAMMDHPNIARVLDGGATDAQSPLGPRRPYFVMELVKGVPITRFCDDERLALTQRLSLFMDACHAVQHAHQKGVIHRDIKPSNVLVSRYDDKPVVKIIDFGIAKAVEGRLTDKTLFTELHQLIGTPAYMSPEQAGLSNLDIDTRSDIYSLGVLLYELLTGTTPFESQRLRSAGVDELRRVIREEEPPRPSTRVSTPGGSRRRGGRSSKVAAEVATGNQDDSGAVSLPDPSDKGAHAASSIGDIARRRSTDARSLRRALQSDLDWIVMKCLEKDRTRRYETANGMTMDVQRYLSGEPVVAAPPSRMYRARKFVRRNRAAVTATALVVVALLVGIAGTTFGLLRAERAQGREREQRELAEKREKETQRVSDFQAAMLQDIDVQAMGRGIKEHFRKEVRAALARQYVGEYPNRRKRTPEEVEAELAAFDERAAVAQAVDIARQVMDEFVLARSAEAIEEVFVDQPLVWARLHSGVGKSYKALGLFDAAELHIRTALEIRLRELGREHPTTLVSISDMGGILQLRGRLAEAEPYRRDAMEISRRVLGDDNPNTLRRISNMGYLLLDLRKFAEAEPFVREALDGRQRVLGDDHPATLISTIRMASLLQYMGKAGEAEPYLRAALEGSRRAKGDDALIALESLGNMGQLLVAQGKPVEAESYARKALEGLRRVRGDDHPRTLIQANNIGLILEEQGRLAEAEQYYREALKGQRRVLGDYHPHTLSTIGNLGSTLLKRGRMAEAERYCRLALEGRRRVLGDDNPDTLIAINNLGLVFYKQGRFDEAELYARESLEGRRRVYGHENPKTLIAIHNMGALLQARGKLAEAEGYFREAVEGLRRKLRDDHPYTLRAISRLCQVLRLQGKLDEAERQTRQLVEIYSANTNPSPLQRKEYREAADLLAGILADAGRPYEAIEVQRELVENCRRFLPADDPSLADILAKLGRSLIEQGQWVEAEPVLRESLAIRESALEPESTAYWMTADARSVLGGVLSRQGTELLDVDPSEATSIFIEAESLLVEAGEWLTQNADAIPQQHRTEKLRQAIERMIGLYEAWDAVAPDSGIAELAAEWRSKLERMSADDGEEQTPSHLNED